MPVTIESPVVPAPTRVNLTPPRLPSKLPLRIQRPLARLALKPSRAAPETELPSTVTSSDLSMRIPRPLLVPRTVLPIMLAPVHSRSRTPSSTLFITLLVTVRPEERFALTPRSPPLIMKPLMVTLSDSRTRNASSSESTCMMAAPPPSMVRLSTLRTRTRRLYVPGATTIVSPAEAASTASSIRENCPGTFNTAATATEGSSIATIPVIAIILVIIFPFLRSVPRGKYPPKCPGGALL